jgi:UDP-N-acetylmuramate: L-alanyl-gamma-D-glutamyl-meso-diaminopimelate ligase
MHYHPNVTIITGVAWDHMNVFPTWESYMKVFGEYIGSLEAGTKLFWFEGDAVLGELVQQMGKHLNAMSYKALNFQDNHVYDSKGKQYPLIVFGAHNLQNMSAAMLACGEVGISEQVFLHAMHDFTGASMRLQLLFERDGLAVFRDFAHAPSKVAATVQAVRERFPKANVIAFLELHTYSSLNAGFLPQYKGSLDKADHAVIFYSPKTLEIKKMPFISPTDITDAFAHASLEVATARKTVEERLSFFVKAKESTVILLMSSGRFENADLLAVIQS